VTPGWPVGCGFVLMSRMNWSNDRRTPGRSASAGTCVHVEIADWGPAGALPMIPAWPTDAARAAR
jgi:hypothetical protein